MTEFIPRPPSRPNRRSRRGLLALLAIAALIAGSAADRWLAPRTAARTTLRPSDLTITVSGPATLEATRRSSVGSRLTGNVATMLVDRNDVVTRGRVIATLEADDLERQLESARASARAAETAIAVARADEARSQAALTNARANLGRQEALLQRGVATAATQDAAQSTYRQTSADLERAKAAVDQAIAQAAAADANVELQAVKVEEATIRAPIDGVVISRSRWIGDTVGPGTEIAAIVDPGSIVFTTRLDESVMARLEPGRTATVRPSGGTPVSAAITQVSRSVDAETREFTVDLRPATLPPNWAIGQRAVAEITIATRTDVLSVPIGAIDRRDGRPTVWLELDGRAWPRSVTTGEVGGDRIEIVSGLAEGDVVLTEPRGIWSGMRVEAAGQRR
ncbi:MAG: efflux RND transporter periplasmic adaptor subunit [Hyphomicrobiales bacterium]|nr:efflux RND transporter periplasmic adaptor subunit [Hyphomicrobiales bacterium]